MIFLFKYKKFMVRDGAMVEGNVDLLIASFSARSLCFIVEKLAINNTSLNRIFRYPFCHFCLGEKLRRL